MARLAVQSRIWPLYEVENGQWILNSKTRDQIPVEEYLKVQGRFAHLFKDGNQSVINAIQEYVDREWDKLLFMSAKKNNQKSPV